MAARRSPTGGPRCTIRDGLAIWNGAGERIWRPLNNPTRIFHTSYLDQTPQGLRPDPARPRVRPLSRRRRLRPPPVDLGRADRRLGQGHGPAGRDPDRRRDPRQYRRLLADRRADARPATASTITTACTGSPDQPGFPAPSSRMSSRPGWAAAASPASRARAGSTSSRSSSWAARWRTCRSASCPSRRSGSAAARSRWSRWKPSRTTCPATGGCSST